MITDEELRELSKRNLERAKKMIEKMGSKYLCHPMNRVRRKEPTNKPQHA